MGKGPILIDTREIDRLVLGLKGFEDEVGEATFHALKRTIEHVKTQTGRIVSKEYSIPQKMVKETFKGGLKTKNSSSGLEVNLLSIGRTLTLARFPHSPIAPPARKKYKVKVAIKREGGRKVITSSPPPFIATTGAKTLDKIQFNVFRREGKKRLPIKPLFTLSIPQMITNEKVAERIQEAASKKLAERMEHEIIYRMTKIKTSR